MTAGFARERQTEAIVETLSLQGSFAETGPDRELVIPALGGLR